jgi:hypothetical protein
MLRVGGECAAKRLELGGDDVAVLGRLVLKDRDLVVSVEFDITVVRDRQPRNDDLQSGAVGGHPRTCEQLFPMQPVDARKQVGGSLDETDECAHRDRDTALGQIAPDAVERREQRELLMHEPGEPFAG